jgi:predicted Zn-dependent protease with MMP-like domain
VELSKAQRNELFRALTNGGLDPESCELHSDATGLWIAHRSTGSKFDYDPDAWKPRVSERTRSSPARVAAEAGAPWRGNWRTGTDPARVWITTGQDRWQALVDNVRQWAKAVVDWQETPDFWALAEAPELAAIEESSDNAPFTPEQQAEVAARIDDVKQLVAEKFELEAGQLEGVLHGLDEIKAASTRVGLKDLRVIVYGYAFGWIANDAIHPSMVQTVVGMIFHAVGHALGLPGQPPALPM